eukprot:CAMPEP_0119345522 /NCGR_PEP_ID=MMETSP1333-20130426/107532_1 /TAXON_ID=418940 /ORGANISM="Scyphosphaera apsteinii, Strain RCC1455" /LENGTH=268 /DNA_ID=CAMNT_0007357997 /DNA_START=212 /DNA_END=1018 /DNA_ORIENTATION=+
MALDNQCLAGAIMFSQRAMLDTHEWKFNYTIGLLMSVKLLKDKSIHLSDVRKYFTKSFTVEELERGEARAFRREMDTLGKATRQIRMFLNSLARMLFELPSLPCYVGLPADERRPPHVLILDDSEVIRTAHYNLVVEEHPNAIVHACSNCNEACTYVSWAEAAEKPVHLLLLDLDLKDEESTSMRGLLTCLSTEDPLSSGLNVPERIDPYETDEMPIHMSFKPMVALVSKCIQKEAHVNAVVHRGCDLALPKPLTPQAVQVLMHFCVS